MLAAFLALALPSPSAPVEPKILPRAAWRAKPPVLPMRSHSITRITVHHTGTAQKPAVPLETKLRNLQSWCQREGKLASGKVKPAWPDIPYHYYISTDGRIGEGRLAVFVGDTNTEYDPTGHLLIVVEGNFEIEQPTDAQMKSLRAMVAWTARRYRVSAEHVQGHGDYAKTDCPGKVLKEAMPSLRESLKP